MEHVAGQNLGTRGAPTYGPDGFPQPDKFTGLERGPDGFWYPIGDDRTYVWELAPGGRGLVERTPDPSGEGYRHRPAGGRSVGSLTLAEGLAYTLATYAIDELTPGVNPTSSAEWVRRVQADNSVTDTTGLSAAQISNRAAVQQSRAAALEGAVSIFNTPHKTDVLASTPPLGLIPTTRPYGSGVKPPALGVVVAGSRSQPGTLAPVVLAVAGLYFLLS